MLYCAPPLWYTNTEYDRIFDCEGYDMDEQRKNGLTAEDRGRVIAAVKEFYGE